MRLLSRPASQCWFVTLALLEQRGCSLLQQLFRRVGQGVSLLAQRLSLGRRGYGAAAGQMQEVQLGPPPKASGRAVVLTAREQQVSHPAGTLSEAGKRAAATDEYHSLAQSEQAVLQLVL